MRKLQNRAANLCPNPFIITRPPLRTASGRWKPLRVCWIDLARLAWAGAEERGRTVVVVFEAAMAFAALATPVVKWTRERPC